jgi:hypothetical protein
MSDPWRSEAGRQQSGAEHADFTTARRRRTGLLARPCTPAWCALSLDCAVSLDTNEPQHENTPKQKKKASITAKQPEGQGTHLRGGLAQRLRRHGAHALARVRLWQRGGRRRGGTRKVSRRKMGRRRVRAKRQTPHVAIRPLPPPQSSGTRACACPGPFTRRRAYTTGRSVGPALSVCGCIRDLTCARSKRVLISPSSHCSACSLSLYSDSTRLDARCIRTMLRTRRATPAACQTHTRVPCAKHTQEQRLRAATASARRRPHATQTTQRPLSPSRMLIHGVHKAPLRRATKRATPGLYTATLTRGT